MVSTWTIRWAGTAESKLPVHPAATHPIRWVGATLLSLPTHLVVAQRVRWVAAALFSLSTHLVAGPLVAQTPLVETEETETHVVGSTEHEIADTTTIPYGFETALRSRYVFRGMAYSHGAASQSTLWFQTGGLSGYFWGNILLEEEAYQKRFNEVDFGISYPVDLGGFSIEPAFDRYAYRTKDGLEDPPTSELSIRLAYTAGPLVLFAKNIVDIEVIRGATFHELGVIHEKPLSASTSWSTRFVLGWGSDSYNEYYMEVSQTALAYAGLQFALDWTATEKIYVRYYAELTRVPTEAFRAQLDSPDILQFGIVLGFSSE